MYLLKKQEMLNLYLVPAAKLKQKIESCLEEEIDVDVTQLEFCAILAECKLLRADFPSTDNRWQKFYSYFRVKDYSSQDREKPIERYCMVPALIALIFLSQGTIDVKAKAISEVFSGQRLLKPVKRGIRDVKNRQIDPSGGFRGIEQRSTLDEQTKKTTLTKEQLDCIIEVIVNVSLVMLPIYASDFPSGDKQQYMKMQVQWYQKRHMIAEKLAKSFKTVPHGDIKLITVRNFIDKARQTDLFDVMAIR